MPEDDELIFLEFKIKVIPGTSNLLNDSINSFRNNNPTRTRECLLLNILKDQIEKAGA